MREPTVLVTGATGAVGPSVVRAFLAAGYSVRTLSLDKPEGATAMGIDARVGDVRDLASVRSAVDGAEVVVHLAAVLHRFDDQASDNALYEQVNVGGTDNVVRATLSTGVRRIVFFSSIAVYGPSSGRLITEATPPRPDTAYARTKLAAEQSVLAARSRGSPIGTVLRAAAVYGTRLKGNYRSLALAIMRRRFVPLGPGLNRRTLVHDRDLAKAAVAAARHPNAPGAVLNVSDGYVHTLADIINAIHIALGRQPPRLHLPLMPARVAISGLETACSAFGIRPPITRALLDKYCEDVAVDASLIKRVAGFTPAMTLQEGWRETMVELRKEELQTRSRP